MTERCDGRYGVPHARSEPFEVTYRCMLHQGHFGPCGSGVVTATAYGLDGSSDDWKSAALRVGESLAASGPDGYYHFTPAQWVEWCVSQIGRSNLRDAFNAGAKWVAQVDDPARSTFSMDRGFAEFMAQQIVSGNQSANAKPADATRRSAAPK